MVTIANLFKLKPVYDKSSYCVIFLVAIAQIIKMYCDPPCWQFVQYRQENDFFFFWCQVWVTTVCRYSALIYVLWFWCNGDFVTFLEFYLPWLSSRRGIWDCKWSFLHSDKFSFHKCILNRNISYYCKVYYANLTFVTSWMIISEILTITKTCPAPLTNTFFYWKFPFTFLNV